MNDQMQPKCGICGRVMTPENSRIRPELFMCDDCYGREALNIGITPDVRKKYISLRLTERQAEGLMNAGNRGIADLHDAGGDEDLDSADAADEALQKLGAAMERSWPSSY